MSTDPNGSPSLGEINRGLLRVEGKVDSALADHEVRLRRTEKWVYALPPTFLLAAASLAVAIVQVVGK